METGLHEERVDKNPYRQFQAWLAEAEAARLAQPLGMTLVTATPEGRPSGRMVLLRGFDERGFVFYTNYQSRKAVELKDNPQAALVFYWAELDRQVRVEGRVERVSHEESDAYFRTRPVGSQLGAWASPQSEVIASREFLMKREAEFLARFGDGPVPRPPHWGGYRVIPEVIEFWEGKPNRLHDRLRFRRQPDGGWLIERMAP